MKFKSQTRSFTFKYLIEKKIIERKQFFLKIKNATISCTVNSGVNFPTILKNWYVLHSVASEFCSEFSIIEHGTMSKIIKRNNTYLYLYELFNLLSFFWNKWFSCLVILYCIMNINFKNHFEHAKERKLTFAKLKKSKLYLSVRRKKFWSVDYSFIYAIDCLQFFNCWWFFMNSSTYQILHPQVYTA